MGLFDAAACAVALALMLYGALRGMARLLLWFAGWIAGWVMAVRYSEPLALQLGARQHILPDHPDLLRLACFLFIFAAVVFAASVLAWLVSRAMKLALLGPVDRMMGAGLGILVAMLLICAATIPILAVWPPDGGWLMNESVLAPYAVAGGEYLNAAAVEPWKSRFGSGAKALFARDSGR